MATAPKRFYGTSEDSATDGMGPGELAIELDQTPTVAVMERPPPRERGRRQAELERSQQESDSKSSGESDDSKSFIHSAVAYLLCGGCS